MELESYLEVLDPDTIRVRGHRIDLAHVVAYYHDGYSAEQIILELPTLSLEEVYAVLTYYLHHRVMVDAYLSRRAERTALLLEEAGRQPPSPGAQTIRALRARQGTDQAA